MCAICFAIVLCAVRCDASWFVRCGALRSSVLINFVFSDAEAGVGGNPPRVPKPSRQGGLDVCNHFCNYVVRCAVRCVVVRAVRCFGGVRFS